MTLNWSETAENTNYELEKAQNIFFQGFNSEGFFTWSSSGVKHVNTVHILEFGSPKQTGRMQWERKKLMHENDPIIWKS